MGQEGEKRTHQEDHRLGHPVLCTGGGWHQRQYHIHHLPGRSKENPGNQTPLPCHDCQKHEEVFHFRGPGNLE